MLTLFILQALSLNAMVTLVLWLALAALVIWLAFFIIGMFNPPHQLRIILTVVVAVVVLYFLLKQLGFI